MTTPKPGTDELTQRAVDGDDRTASFALWQRALWQIDLGKPDLTKWFQGVAKNVCEAEGVDRRRRRELLLRATGLGGATHTMRYRQAMTMWQQLAALDTNGGDEELWWAASVAQRVVQAASGNATVSRSKAATEALGLSDWFHEHRVPIAIKGNDTWLPGIADELEVMASFDGMTRADLTAHLIAEHARRNPDAKPLAPRTAGNRVDKLLKRRK